MTGPSSSWTPDRHASPTFDVNENPQVGLSRKTGSVKIPAKGRYVGRRLRFT